MYERYDAPPHLTALESSYGSVPALGRASLALLWICFLGLCLGLLAAPVAKILVELIHFFTQLFFYGRFSVEYATPAGHELGAWVILVPVIGGIIVGCMARWGAAAIRGHGIPEAMEQVLLNESRIPARITFLKPLSSAISIGTGGPFGAEGPIIATGGALGSVLGQFLHITAQERKVLLAAGAAAGALPPLNSGAAAAGTGAPPNCETAEATAAAPPQQLEGAAAPDCDSSPPNSGRLTRIISPVAASGTLL